MKCTKCGSEILDGALKCPVCGETVQADEINPGIEEEQENTVEEEEEQESPGDDSDESEEKKEGLEGTAQGELSEEKLDNQSEEGADPKDSMNSEDAEIHMEEMEQQGKTATQRNAVAFLKRNWVKGVLAISVIALICCVFAYSQLSKDYKKLSYKSGKLEKDFDELYDEYTDLKKASKTLEQKNAEMSDEINELKNGAAVQLVNIKNAFEDQKWDEVIRLSTALHNNYNGSAEDQEAQELAKQSQAKIDEAKAAEEAKKAQGYETGISYDQLARTPEEFRGEKVKFYGKVVQVLEGSPVAIRLAVDDNYDTILYGTYLSNIVSQRVLEGDHITIYGTSEGTKTYTSTLGSSITIPDVYIEKIDQ